MKFEVGKTYREKLYCDGIAYYTYYYITRKSENCIWVKHHKDSVQEKRHKLFVYKDEGEYFKGDISYVFRFHVEEVK